MGTVAAAAVVARRRWRVAGRVQGVGFRPFVYRLANEHHLTGWVLNDPAGVVIEAQGPEPELDGFAIDVRRHIPASAIVENLTANDVPVQEGEATFEIRDSASGDDPRTQVAVDLAVCDDCLREMRDAKDRRRNGYPLINCTHCGPRYSIIQRLPYDRANTTMSAFKMCSTCQAEYVDPNNRRFHAQPTACNVCGPHVRLVDARDQNIAGDPIAVTADMLKAGKIVAIKGIGGYHLSVRADSEEAVTRLRGLKHRLHKPFALMCRSLADARKIVQLSAEAERAMTAPGRPIVLARRLPRAQVAKAVAAHSHRLGVMLAYTPVHHLIFDQLGDGVPTLVMTSGNDSDQPLVFDDKEIATTLAPMCDAVLKHERPIARPVDDSIVLDLHDGPKEPPLILRRARGFAPAPIPLPVETKWHGIALGGELKSTIAVVRDSTVILSQHLGDLLDAHAYVNFKKAVDDLRDLFALQPKWIAHDLHPQYLSTSYAAQLSAKLRIPHIRIQHHHAHAASVLAEHGEHGPALAVICDGTGYGSNGATWGGELMIADLHGYKRIGHLRPLRLPGGDASARQPWRSALALLFNALGDQFDRHPICRALPRQPNEIHFVAEMIRGNTSCATSTSTGRLFDGIAALLGLAHDNHYDAQAPMMLESAAAASSHSIDKAAPLFELSESNQIDLSPFVRRLVEQVLKGASVPDLAAMFHEQLAMAWEAAVLRNAERTGLSAVVLSGGVFCNERLATTLTRKLRDIGLHVMRNRLVPPNDGGLAYGQAAIAATRAAKEKF